MHPLQKTQPPPYFAAFLVNRVVFIAVPAPRPSGFPSQTIAKVHRFLLRVAQATSFATGTKNPLVHFGATVLERQNFCFKIFRQILKHASFGHNEAKFGQFCILGGLGLPNSVAF